MALEMNGEERIAASVENVWEAINDPETLRACIPGCESLEKLGDNKLLASVVLKIGPVKATFGGSVVMKNINRPHSLTIEGEGRGGIAGFAKGGADVVLLPDGADATILKYTSRADVGGKIAQLGSRLIESTSRKLVAQFFTSMSQKIGKNRNVA